MKVSFVPLAISCAALVTLTARAQLTVTELGGGVFSNNFSTLPGSSAFGKDEIGAGTLPQHKIPNVRDSVYGNSNSWIGDSANSFIGISFGAVPLSVGQIAFGRDNTGTFFDRTEGAYTLQYTTTPSPDATTPDGSWLTIGSITQTQNDAGVYSSSRRHAFDFLAVSATGMRLITPGSSFASGACIDELEFAPFAPAPLTLQLTGGTMNSATNIALDANGAIAFAKDLIGNGSFSPTHAIPNLNDGIYGNANSWIGETEDSFAGVRFANPQEIRGVAFGRDNTAQFGDRADGYYLIQYTTVSSPDASTPDSSWNNIGPAFLDASDPNRALRHEYSFAPVSGATGLRIITPGVGLTSGRAIDELEIYAVPEAGSAALACVGVAMLFRRRRRT